MRVLVTFRPGEREASADLPEGARGLDLVRSLGLSPDRHLLVRGAAPIPEDEPLRDGDRVQVIGVVSGG